LRKMRGGDGLLKIIKEDPRHFYFYWNVIDFFKIEVFKRKYNNAKYTGMLNVLKGEY